MATIKEMKIPQIVKRRPIAASIISKTNGSNINIRKKPGDINIPEIGRATTEKVKNNEDILELFPDIELAIRILVSSILSPNDMVGSKLTFEAPDINIPISVKQSIVDVMKRYIDKNYKLEEHLYTMVKEALFTKGAYIEAIIPEASVDDVIHQIEHNKIVSLESFITYYKSSTSNGTTTHISSTNINIDHNVMLSNNAIAKIENISQEDLLIEIDTDPKILNITNAVMLANEHLSYKNLFKGDEPIDMSQEDALDKIFKDNSTMKFKDTVEVPTGDDASRKSIGRPMIMKLPTEAVIPVHVVNNPSKHLGYFVILDENGVPINMDNTLNQKFQGNDLYTFEESQSTKQFNLVQKAKNALTTLTKKDPTLSDLESIYSSVVENMIRDKIRKGAYGELAEVRNEAEIYRTMFSRALKAQKTKILYLPADLVSYYAFDYRDNGTGRSLIEKSSILFSVRSILLFTKLMAQLKNSVTVTNVDATIEDDDPDPESTMNSIISNAMKTRQTLLPFGVTNLDDLVEWSHSVGFRFNFQGAGLPNMKLDVTDVQSSKVVPDDSLDENIRKFIYMSFGLTAEMLDAAYQVDYATTLVSNNILFAKYITQLQTVLNSLNRKHVQKLCLNDPILQAELKNEILNNISNIKDNIKKEIKVDSDSIDKLNVNTIVNYILKKFINGIEVRLPTPEVSEADSLNKALSVYMDNLDKYLDVIMSDSNLPSAYLGQLGGQMGNIKQIFKSMLVKRWMGENNYLPEINEAITRDVDGTMVFDIANEFDSYIASLGEVMEPVLKKLAKTKNKNDKKLEKPLQELDNSGGDSGGFGGDYSTTNSGDTISDNTESGSDGGDNDFDFGGDDFGNEGGESDNGTDDNGDGETNGSEDNTNNSDNNDNSGNSNDSSDSGSEKNNEGKEKSDDDNKEKEEKSEDINKKDNSWG